MPTTEGQRTQLTDLAAPPLLLSTPFLIFVQYHGYPLLAPETGLCMLALGLSGLALGAAISLIGTPLRVPVIALLATLFIDLQTDAIRHWDHVLLLVLAGCLLAAFLLRSVLSPLACLVGVTLFVTSLVLPDRPEIVSHESGELPPPRAGLPPVVHILLDEQIGIEGLPLRFDPERRHAEALKRFYLERGFKLFGGAFALSTASVSSISNLLNFNLDPPFDQFVDAALFKNRITHNAYFREMADQGYQIHVYQSDYLDFCHNDDPLPVASCFTYPLETIRSIETAPLPATEKASVMAGMYARLSFLLGKAFSERATSGRVSAASVMPVFDLLEHDLADAEDGVLYFVHLMLPHYPYAYDAACNIRPDTSDWLNNSDKSHFPMSNTPESQALRYALYLDQVACTHRRLTAVFEAMQRTGHFETARIIVHGDHGSRIFLAPLDLRVEESISPEDYLDAYSTLFAVRGPGGDRIGGTPAYDDRMLPIGRILEDITLRPDESAGSDWAGPPTVYLSRGGFKDPVARPLPIYRGGVAR